MPPPAAYQLFYSLPHDVRRLLYAAARPRQFWKLQEKRGLRPERDYSFRPFDENRCIFVHVPKTAGVSVSLELFGNLSGGHTPIATYEVVFSKREFTSYFKFGFVRNPWDRLYSAYRFLKSGGMSEYDSQWAKNNLSDASNFTDFVKYHLRKKNIINSIHFTPQYRFLCRPRSHEVRIDFIGKYEFLDRDFTYVKKRLGLRVQGGPPHFNQGKLGCMDYRSAYTPETCQIVADVYWRDIELFGYDFQPMPGRPHENA